MRWQIQSYIYCVRQWCIQMLEDGIPPSLRGSVDFVASGGIPTRCQGARLVGNFVGTSLAFRFVKIGLEMRSGPHGLCDGLWGFVMGLHTHMSLHLR
jgi:hypothetical protein